MGFSPWTGWVGDVTTRILRVVGSQAQKGDVIWGLRARAGVRDSQIRDSRATPRAQPVDPAACLHFAFAAPRSLGVRFEAIQS